MALSRTGLVRQSVRNVAQAVALLAAMALWTSALGWIVAGGIGALVGLGAAVLAVLGAQRVTPRMVLGLYGARRLVPEQAPGLFRIVRALAARAEVATPELYYIASSVPNAIAVGSRRRPGLAVTDGLLRRLSQRELIGVLAHEISHIRNGDLAVMAMADSLTRYSAFLGQLGGLILLFAILFLQPQLLAPAFVLVLGPIFSALLMLALSRSREFHADLGAVRLTGDPRGLATALRRIEQPTNLAEQIFGLPGRDLSPSLLRTHPGTDDRVARLRELDDSVGPPLDALPPLIALPPVEREARRAWWGARY